MADNRDTSGARIAVVHLIRKSNGIKPFQAFLESYHRFKEPLAHDLVLIFKDFQPGEDAGILGLLENQAFVRHDFPVDAGFDLGPYEDVSRKLEYAYFCFLNSFSRIECDNWLTHLFDGLRYAPDAGVISATGSWESSASTDPTFPNPHIRTNGFLISGDLMNKIRFIDIQDKDDVREIESGRQSLTRQIQALGKRAYVVDRAGKCWPEESWDDSATFRSGGQSGLIISDNRTRAFAEGDAWTQEYLHALAWTGNPSRANPFKRHKLRHRVRRFMDRLAGGK